MTQASPEVLYPRLLRRVRAYLIDSVLFIILIFAWMISLPLFGESSFLLKILALALPIMIIEPGLVSLTGGTPGHHIMGLRIRDASRDKNIDFIRATARAVVRTLLGWLSFVFVLVTQRHQALHDYFTSTVVVLRHPENFPIHEKFASRTVDDVRYTYPSKARRVIVIILYTFLSVVVLSVLGIVFVSDECAITNRCTASENLIANVLSVIWIIFVSATIVLGWRGLLYGCRRSALPQGASTGS